MCQPKPVSMEETSSFSSLRIVRDRAHSLPGWNFQYPQIASIITGLLEDQTINPPFLRFDCRHNKHIGTGPIHHTPRKPSMRGRTCSYPPVEKAPEIDRLHLGENASVWRAPLWLRLWKYGFRSVELKISIGNVFFSGKIQGLLLGGEHWGMVSLCVPWDVLFQMAMKRNFFSYLATPLRQNIL